MKKNGNSSFGKEGKRKVEAKLYIELNHADTCHKSYLKLCVLPQRREPQCQRVDFVSWLNSRQGRKTSAENMLFFLEAPTL